MNLGLFAPILRTAVLHPARRLLPTHLLPAHLRPRLQAIRNLRPHADVIGQEEVVLTQSW
ncbi:MAG: hypothetical protein EBT07_13310 [Actinobacteria bacterium]|nr:hypothetical protein [Actinomycetota bacterium]